MARETTVKWPQTKQPGDVGTVQRGDRVIGHLVHSGRTSLDQLAPQSFGQCEAHYNPDILHDTRAVNCARNACRQFDSESAAVKFLERIDSGEVC